MVHMNSSGNLHETTGRRMARIDLRWALSGVEEDVVFPSLHELLALHVAEVVRGGWRDHRVCELAALEAALQAPMKMRLHHCTHRILGARSAERAPEGATV